MPRIRLPDGSERTYDAPVTARQVAADIGPRLAAAALGARVNGRLRDLATVLDRDCELALVTEKTRSGEPDPDALFLLRHSAAHVLAEAVQKVLPGVHLVYGPPVENGFFYDMRLPEGASLSSNDFAAIEKEMQAIVDADRPFTRHELGGEEGLAKVVAEGNKYKEDNARRALAGKPHDLREGDAVDSAAPTLSFYTTGRPGRDWEDLCGGPHLPSTGRIKAFKVTSLASSYWHGDADSDRLLRVYGTAFFHPEDLERYLTQLEEAKKRDHRAIGKQLQLFHIDEMVGQGLVLWTPAGAVLRQELQSFIAGELAKRGYQQVFTPHIGKLDLYRTSGHYPYYTDSQYPPLIERETLVDLAGEGATCADLAARLQVGDVDGYLLKPMNCPHHIRLFASQPHSYRDLPVRFAEFGTVYRWEQSGELNGMVRVRGFTQDDAHLFCTEDQVQGEIRGCLDLVKIVLTTLGLEDYRVRVGLRDPDSNKYAGSPEVWARAEAACRAAARTLGAPFTEEPGEAAFYGPKIDFVVKDAIGREWQLGTVQVDYNLPERFDLSYVGADNERHRPVMIHRAPFGSMERFCGVLIEHFAGAFPAWLAPEQVRVLPISEKTADYASQVHAALAAAGVRVTTDAGDERLQGKIREAAERKVPYMAIVGPRDAAARNVSVRARGIPKDLGTLALDEFVAAVAEEIRTRGTRKVTERFPSQS
jgi:threonyl-tRNA synthetase